MARVQTNTNTKLARQIEEKARQVLTYLGRGRMSRDDIDDLVQGVVERVYRAAQRRPDLRGDELSAYAATAARNAATDHWKGAGRRKNGGFDVDYEAVQSLVPDAELTPSSRVVAATEKKRRVAAINEALEEVNPCDKRLFEMFYKDGMTHQEIADALGYKTAAVVKTKMARMRNRAEENLPQWLTRPPGRA